MKNGIENREYEMQPEILDIQPVDCVAVLGRGIEKVIITSEDGSKKEAWQPTKYVQKLDESGIRTGNREKMDIADEQAWVGGGKANTLATIEVLQTLEKKKSSSKLLIIAAGRPKYLDDEPEGFSEAIPMRKIIEDKIGSKYETIIQTDDRNSQDDVVNALKNAFQKKCGSIAFINTEIAMPRTKEFCRLALEENPEFQSLRVDFYTSEEILNQRYGNSKFAKKAFAEIQKELKRSGAWKHTEEGERGGLEAIKAGKYSGRGRY
jgi:hypothetical protein